MIGWPLCVLVLGLAFVVALWDGLRRYAATAGVNAQLERTLDERTSKQVERIEKCERAISEYATQTTAEIRSMQAAGAMRSARMGS
jgi:hypothetical protein